MTPATLNVDIRSYWYPGTGRGSGFHLDALTHAGADGLPRLPGRTLKGLLRDAVFRAETWGWEAVPEGITESLFGPLGRDGEETRPGRLRVSDATLPEEVAGWLTTQEGKKLVAGLYREHFSTAIDPDSGVAKGRSLRGMQVVVPLMLESTIQEVSAVASDGCDWRGLLRAVFPLVSAVGGHRSRGFGRAVLAWKEG